MGSLRIQLLGSFSVCVGPKRVLDTTWRRRRKAAQVLKLLALAPGHRLHREQVSECLWPDMQPRAAANNLHQTLHGLRHSLEPDLTHGHGSSYVHLRADTLQLHAPGGLWVDVEAFQITRLRERSGADPALYEAAIEYYRGGLLPDDRYAEWAAAGRESLREEYLTLLMDLAKLL
jgi:DNA-binding SARP family transcriptional activator